MPVVPTPLADPDPIDLATGSFVTQVLLAGGVTLTTAQAAILGTQITAASREIIRYCNRLFSLATYSEILMPEGGRQDRNEPPTAKLAMFPIVDVLRCATNRMSILTVKNIDQSTNQETSIKFATTGDVEYSSLAYTGMKLSRTASGTVTTDTIAWTTESPYTTIASVAASINGLSGGWSAATSGGSSPNLALLPAAYLVGAREIKGAGSSGVSLDLFGTPYSDYAIERSTGILSCYGWSAGGGFGGWSDDAWGGYGYGGGCGAYGQVQVTYKAGFAVIPQDLQMIVAEAVKGMFARLDGDPSLKSETADKYSWQAKDSVASLSSDAMVTLNRYKAWSC